MKRALGLVTYLLYSIILLAQVSISTDNSSPHASAMLDIKSNSKGILVPRMSTSARNAIGSPAKGLMVYDSTVNSFFFFNGTAWLNVSGSSTTANQITDADNDTKVQVEANADEDKIRILFGKKSQSWRQGSEDGPGSKY